MLLDRLDEFDLVLRDQYFREPRETRATAVAIRPAPVSAGVSQILARFHADVFLLFSDFVITDAGFNGDRVAFWIAAWDWLSIKSNAFTPGYLLLGASE